MHFQTSVDRRPSKIKITGFDNDDKVTLIFINLSLWGIIDVLLYYNTLIIFSSIYQEAIIAQFRRFGEVLETLDSDQSEGETEAISLIIHYKTRKEAEIAMIQGKTFGEQPLQLSWWVIVNIARNIMLTLNNFLVARTVLDVCICILGSSALLPLTCKHNCQLKKQALDQLVKLAVTFS